MRRLLDVKDGARGQRRTGGEKFTGWLCGLGGCNGFAIGTAACGSFEIGGRREDGGCIELPIQVARGVFARNTCSIAYAEPLEKGCSSRKGFWMHALSDLNLSRFIYLAYTNSGYSNSRGHYDFIIPSSPSPSPPAVSVGRACARRI